MVPRAVGFTIVWPEGVIFGSIMTYHVQFLLLVRQPLFDRAALPLTQTSWVLPPLSVGKMTLRLYGALNYRHGFSKGPSFGTGRGAGRRRVPTFGTSLPRSEPSRRLREARWQRSVWQRTTPIWVDSHGVAWTPSPLLPKWQSRRRSLQDPQRSSYLSFGLLLFDAYSTDFGTSMPSMSVEESIPSLDGGSTRTAA